MYTALMADERTDLVSTNRLGHGWASGQWVYQKLSNQSRESVSQQPILSAIWLRYV